jgi:HlyD family secretion protein
MLTRKRTMSLAAIPATIIVAVVVQAFRADELPRAAAAAAAASDASSWEAVALGRVEPRSREIKLSAPILGRVMDVSIRTGDQIFAGELLVRLDDEEALARVAAAEAQVALRKRARNDQSTPTVSAQRRKVEDAVADAEQGVADARSALDNAAADWRAGNTSRTEVDAARSALTQAQGQLRDQQNALSKLNRAADTALPSRLEGELNVARAELALARATLEKTRIRAPFDGTVLQVDAKKGEMAVPTSEPALLVVGDTSGLRVRAEVDEQYFGKIRAGHPVQVRAAAFAGQSFAGKVASVGRLVGPSRINARGPRKANDVDVLEVVIDLADAGPLVVGAQVDVFFVSERSEQAMSQ